MCHLHGPWCRSGVARGGDTCIGVLDSALNARRGGRGGGAKIPTRGSGESYWLSTAHGLSRFVLRLVELRAVVLRLVLFYPSGPSHGPAHGPHAADMAGSS